MGNSHAQALRDPGVLGDTEKLVSSRIAKRSKGEARRAACDYMPTKKGAKEIAAASSHNDQNGHSEHGEGNNDQAKSGNGNADIGDAVLRAAKGNEYRPTDKEPFMNERQRDYFRQKLLSWREDILNQVQETLQHLQDENQNHPDLTDRASSETNRGIVLEATLSLS